jgi:hypothetical protein
MGSCGRRGRWPGLSHDVSHDHSDRTTAGHLARDVSRSGSGTNDLRPWRLRVESPGVAPRQHVGFPVGEHAPQAHLEEAPNTPAGPNGAVGAIYPLTLRRIISTVAPGVRPHENRCPHQSIDQHESDDGREVSLLQRGRRRALAQQCRRVRICATGRSYREGLATLFRM